MVLAVQSVHRSPIVKNKCVCTFAVWYGGRERECVCVVRRNTFVKIRFRHDSAVKSGMQAMQNTWPLDFWSNLFITSCAELAWWPAAAKSFWLSTKVVYLQRCLVVSGWCHVKLLPSLCVVCTPGNYAPFHITLCKATCMVSTATLLAEWPGSFMC